MASADGSRQNWLLQWFPTSEGKPGCLTECLESLPLRQCLSKLVGQQYCCTTILATSPGGQSPYAVHKVIVSGASVLPLPVEGAIVASRKSSTCCGTCCPNVLLQWNFPADLLVQLSLECVSPGDFSPLKSDSAVATTCDGLALTVVILVEWSSLEPLWVLRLPLLSWLLVFFLLRLRW